jgi:hypothetical protein
MVISCFELKNKVLAVRLHQKYIFYWFERNFYFRKLIRLGEMSTIQLIHLFSIISHKTKKEQHYVAPFRNL